MNGEKISAAVTKVVGVIDAQIGLVKTNKVEKTADVVSIILKSISDDILSLQDLFKDKELESACFDTIKFTDLDSFSKYKDSNKEMYESFDKIVTGIEMLRKISKDDMKTLSEQLKSAKKMLIAGVVLLGCAALAVAFPAMVPISSTGVAGVSAFTGLCTIAYAHHLTKTDLSKAVVESGKTLQAGLKALEVELTKTVGGDGPSVG
ncbi:MAG: hypothetical protein ACK5AV_04740 [Alphaproteobacteria bacterium]|jgi:hypothetical protein